jgi:hypothetical protein
LDGKFEAVYQAVFGIEIVVSQVLDCDENLWNTRVPLVLWEFNATPFAWMKTLNPLVLRKRKRWKQRRHRTSLRMQGPCPLLIESGFHFLAHF